jgi:hypothetical protein
MQDWRNCSSRCIEGFFFTLPLAGRVGERSEPGWGSKTSPRPPPRPLSLSLQRSTLPTRGRDKKARSIPATLADRHPEVRAQSASLEGWAALSFEKPASRDPQDEAKRVPASPPSARHPRREGKSTIQLRTYREHAREVYSRQFVR